MPRCFAPHSKDIIACRVTVRDVCSTCRRQPVWYSGGAKKDRPKSRMESDVKSSLANGYCLPSVVGAVFCRGNPTVKLERFDGNSTRSEERRVGKECRS